MEEMNHRPGLRRRRGKSAAPALQAQPLGQRAAGRAGGGVPQRGRGPAGPPHQGPALLFQRQPAFQVPCRSLCLPVSGGAGLLYSPPAHQEGHRPADGKYRLYGPEPGAFSAAVSGGKVARCEKEERQTRRWLCLSCIIAVHLCGILPQWCPESWPE